MDDEQARAPATDAPAFVTVPTADELAALGEPQQAPAPLFETRHYSKVINPTTLHEALATVPGMVTVGPDGVREAHYQLFPDEHGQVRLDVPVGTDLAAVDAIVAAHDASVQSPAQQQEAADTLNLGALRDRYQQRLTQIGQGRTQLLAGDDAGWAALTAVQRAERLRAVLLGQMDFNEDVLQALRVVLRRINGG